MADLAKLSTGVRIVRPDPLQEEGVAGADHETGDLVRIDPTSGRYVAANATAAGNAPRGIVGNKCRNGQPVTIHRNCEIEGFDLSARAFNDPIYVSNTNKALGDAAGTVSTVVARVIPTAVSGGVALEKILKVQVP